MFELLSQLRRDKGSFELSACLSVYSDLSWLPSLVIFLLSISFDEPTPIIITPPTSSLVYLSMNSPFAPFLVVVNIIRRRRARNRTCFYVASHRLFAEYSLCVSQSHPSLRASRAPHALYRIPSHVSHASLPKIQE